MKKVKKLLGVLFIVVALVCVMAVSASAESRKIISSGNCGGDIYLDEVVTWVLYDDFELVISGNGPMQDYHITHGRYSKTDSPFCSLGILDKVTIESGVTDIGRGAFMNSSIRCIELGDTIEEIDDYAFFNCHLYEKDIIIPNSVTRIGDAAFANCNLESINIPASVIDIGADPFYKCNNLKDITVCDVNSKALYNGIFETTAYFEILKQNEAEDFYMGNTFLGLTSLRTTYKLKEGTTVIAKRAFLNQDELTSIIIPNSVKHIGREAFLNCSSLTSIEIPDSVETIDPYAFKGCTNLKNIKIGNGVTQIGFEAFCDTEYYNNTDNWNEGLLYIDNHLIASKDVVGYCIIKEGTISIAARAFENSEITSVVLPDTLKGIGAQTFKGCHYIEEINLPPYLEKIGISAFYSTSIDNIYIPKTVNEIGEDISRGWDTLSASFVTVDADNKNYSSDDSGTLFNKDKTILIHYPSVNKQSNYNIPHSVIKISAYAFEWASHLKTIEIPDSVTEIGQFAFYQATNLISLKIPNNLKKIEPYTFKNCTKLENLIIGKNVRRIGKQAFEGCTNLKEIIIPEGVRKIDDFAFYGCADIYTKKNIILPKSLESCGERIFYVGYSSYVNLIHYAGNEEDWKNMLQHSHYRNYISDIIHYNCKYSDAIPNTCTEPSYSSGFFCAICKNETENDGWVSGHKVLEPAKGHEKTKLIQIETVPTCTATGTEIYYCGVCKVKHKITTNSLGHSFTNYISDNNATCTKNGTKTAKCDNNCGLTDTVTDYGSATGHSYEEVIYNPTCTENGYIEYTCHCGRHYTETIEATGHDFEGSKCKNCPFDRATECSCNCHAGGIKTFFFNFINFFQKLFGQNKICTCGANH